MRLPAPGTHCDSVRSHSRARAARPTLTAVMQILRIVATLLCAAPYWAAAQSAVVHTDQVRAELVAHAPRGLVPGAPAWLGLAITHQPHWHSYWKNPGDSGMATTLRWTLPEGVTAGEIEWPTPQRLPVGPLINYGYEGELLLPVALAWPPTFTAGAIDVKLRAEWLVCKDVCIPQSGEFALRVPVGPTAPLAHAAAFERARGARPQSLAGVTALARVQAEALTVEVSGLPAPWSGKRIEFFAEDAGVIDHAARIEQRWGGDSLHLRVPLSAQRSESPQPMRAVLATPGQPAGVALSFAVEGGWPAPGAAPPLGTPPLPPRSQDVSAAADGKTWPMFMLLLAGVTLLAGLVWLWRRARR